MKKITQHMKDAKYNKCSNNKVYVIYYFLKEILDNKQGALYCKNY